MLEMSTTLYAVGNLTLKNIQVLRGVAALMVVSHHILSALSRRMGWEFPGIGAAGVDIFFIISGFIMVYSTSGPRSPEPTDFLRRRFIRVVPLYTLGTLAVFGLCFIGFPPNGLRDPDGTVEQLVLSLLYWPFVRWNGDIFPLLTVGWTLNFEMMFYILFAIALVLRRRIHPALPVLALIVAIATAGAFMPADAPLAARFFTNGIILEFAFGVVIGIVIRHDNRLTPRGLRALGTGLIAAGILGLVGSALVGLDFGHLDAMRVVVWGLPAAAIVAGALALERGGVVLSGRFLLLQGDASYSTYLVHLIAIQIAVIALYAVAAPTSLFMVALVGVALTVMCVALGIAVHLVVERPITAFLRNGAISLTRWVRPTG